MRHVRRLSPARWSARLLRIAVVASLVAGLALTGVPGVRPQQPQASIVDLDFFPEDPSVGEPITLVATVRNSVEAQYGFEITRIEIRERRSGVNELLTGQDDLGTLGPGDTSVLSLSTRFETPGVKDLQFIVYGTSTGSGGGSTIRYPVTVVVEDTRPSLDSSYGDLLVEADNQFTVTVNNGKNSPIRDVRVRLGGEGFTVEEPVRSAAVVAGGESVPFEFEISSEAPGTRVVEIDLQYTVGGVRYGYQETRQVTFKQFGEKVATVSAFAQDPSRVRPGGPLTLSFEITNHGETPLRDLTFTLDLNGTPLRAGVTGTDVYVRELPANRDLPVTYRLRASENAGSGIVTVPLQYRFTTEDGQVVTERTTLSVEILGDPELRPFVRGVEPTEDGYEVTVDVANVGDGVARAARIAIGNSSYFLGDIDDGEFETATLFVPRGGDHVAVMNYKNGFNEPIETEASVAVPVAEGGVPATSWFLGLAVVVVLGAGFWWWRSWQR